MQLNSGTHSHHAIISLSLSTHFNQHFLFHHNEIISCHHTCLAGEDGEERGKTSCATRGLGEFIQEYNGTMDAIIV